MNEIYVVSFSALLFIVISILAFRLLWKYKLVYILLGLLLYILLSIFILFPFGDFLSLQLNNHGIKTYYSHNDMVLIFEIIVGCLIISILNIIAIIIKNRKRLGTPRYP